MSNVDQAIHEMKSRTELGGGAQFWVYVSPMNDTEKYITKWVVTFIQGDWAGIITSDNPREILRTPGLSGTFQLKVEGGGPTFPIQQLKPGKGDTKDIGCNSNCSSMVKIVAVKGRERVCYSPTWNAVCA